ncbi:uncharacterized protein [Atheta coriaria]|uniref:uncharacterized protein n=1 Tax=Dalotia coriaria TaxID=877792 RepID=UPI0031F35660
MSETILLCTPEEVLWKLTDQKIFIQLRDIFKSAENDGGVDKEAFIHMITTVWNDETNITEAQILDLFNKINIHEAPKITWDNFLDFNLKALQPKSENPLQLGEITYRQPKELKRDAIVKIVLLETDLYFSYALLVKYGKILLLDAEFKHLTSYQVIMTREDQFRSAQDARKRYRWLTDAVFLADVNMFIVVNSTRSMTIYDASGLKHVPLWHISGFPNIIQVILYNDRKKSLLLGMDNGEIAMLTFFNAKDDLLPKKHQDKMSFYYFLELGAFKDYIQYKSIGIFHSKVAYTTRHEKSKSANYFNLNKPLETIRAGKTGIVDIVIFETLEMFICCSRDAELRFYDLTEYKNLQNVKLNFECFDIFKIRTPEWGVKCIFPGPKRANMTQTWERNCLLITCCNAYAKLDLFYMDGRERHLHDDFLPSQPLQNSVLIPQDWETCNDNKTVNYDDLSMRNHRNESFETLWDSLLKMDFSAKEKSDVHSKIALLEERKAKMKWAVEHGAPFLALPLYEVKEVQLPTRLPIVDNKKTKTIVDKTQKLLSDAVSHTIVFSDISSSRTSRSSSKCSKSSSNSKISSNLGRLSRTSSRTSIFEFE